jgi:hypothetical protein
MGMHTCPREPMGGHTPHTHTYAHAESGRERERERERARAREREREERGREREGDRHAYPPIQHPHRGTNNQTRTKGTLAMPPRGLSHLTASLSEKSSQEEASRRGDRVTTQTRRGLKARQYGCDRVSIQGERQAIGQATYV